MEKERLLEWLKTTASEAEVLEVLTTARKRYHGARIQALEEELYYAGIIPTVFDPPKQK